MYYLEIKANAFLWHQIRCIMAVLLLIGQKREQPSIISELLDVCNNPCKPQYTPAIGLPLNLFQCDFRASSSPAETSPQETNNENTETDLTNWFYNKDNLQKVVENLQCEWAQFSIKSTMIRNVLEQLEDLFSSKFQSQMSRSQVLLLQDAVSPRQYQPLLQRKRCGKLIFKIIHELINISYLNFRKS